MKFLVFADLHYAPAFLFGATLEKLKQMQERAVEEGCDFMIHAGDFCHGVDGVAGQGDVAGYIKAYNESVVPAYHAMGNHDTDHTPYEEMLKRYRMPDGHYFFDCGGYRFIVCDPNYYYDDGEYVHYSEKNYLGHMTGLNYMPPEQLIWLKQTIASSPYPCILISHQSFEQGRRDCIKNVKEVRRIINEANAAKPGSVLLCINGHYHRDHVRILDNVIYWDLNSATYDCLSKCHSYYPEEICKAHEWASKTLVYAKPLYAIVELTGTTISVQGMESDTFMGVTWDMLDSADTSSRPGSAVIQTLKITL